MDNNQNQDKILFSVTEEELQQEAKHRIGRKLTEDELHTAKKCIECGLSFGIGTVFQAAIQEAVS